MGWLGLDKTADKGKMVWQEFEPKTWEETDVDNQISHSGICGFGSPCPPKCLGKAVFKTLGQALSQSVGADAISMLCRQRDYWSSCTRRQES